MRETRGRKLQGTIAGTSLRQQERMAKELQKLQNSLKKQKMAL